MMAARGGMRCARAPAVRAGMREQLTNNPACVRMQGTATLAE
jgi:hypothetical protein